MVVRRPGPAASASMPSHVHSMFRGIHDQIARVNDKNLDDADADTGNQLGDVYTNTFSSTDTSGINGCAGRAVVRQVEQAG